MPDLNYVSTNIIGKLNYLREDTSTMLGRQELRESDIFCNAIVVCFSLYPDYTKIEKQADLMFLERARSYAEHIIEWFGFTVKLSGNIIWGVHYLDYDEETGPEYMDDIYDLCAVLTSFSDLVTHHLRNYGLGPIYTSSVAVSSGEVYTAEFDSETGEHDGFSGKVFNELFKMSQIAKNGQIYLRDNLAVRCRPEKFDRMTICNTTPVYYMFNARVDKINEYIIKETKNEETV